MDEHTKITPEKFKAWPPLLDTADLLALGLTEKYIYAARWEVRTGRDLVPFGRLGWIRNPSNPTNGQGAASNHKGKWRRSDVARILGPEWQ